MVAEFLRDPAGTARITVRVAGRGDGPPDLADARVVAALESRREQGVGLEGMDTAGVHRRPPLIGSAVPAFAGALAVPAFAGAL